MEMIKILGIDPSLRNTGIALVTYNNSLAPTDPAAFSVSHCQVLQNPAKYTGKDALLNMIDMVCEQSSKQYYIDVDSVLIELPPVMYNKAWSAGTIAPMAAVAGACTAKFGADKSYLFYPSEWNKTRKKEVTHNRTVAFLGNPDQWHYEQRVKKESLMEHIIDAASIALWWIKSNYIEEEEMVNEEKI